MLKLSGLMATLSLAVGVGWAQSPATLRQSPKDVVAEFWTMEINGGRLTSDGWYKASSFFIRPNAFPPKLVIHVISGTGYEVDETAKTDTWAEVYVGTTEFGSIDSQLRFEPVVKLVSHEKVVGPLVKFDLVLTDRRWELEPDGAMGREVTGPRTWRIVSTDWEANAEWIRYDTAIRYITETRDKNSDPVVKNNGNATLTALSKLKQ